MTVEDPFEPSRRTLPTFSRKTVRLSPSTLVESRYLDARQFPLVVEPAVDHLNAVAWVSGIGEYIQDQLLKHGAILFRGFNIEGARGFEEFARAISPHLLDYSERSSPRSEINRGIYTSTDHPADQYIHFHNEQSYSHNWPLKLFFFCAQPAATGGSTLIADGRRVLELIAVSTRQRFIENKVMYLHNYHPGIGLSWQTAFQTPSKIEVEDYCRTHAIEFEWKGNDRLRTRQFFKAIVAHPKTGESVWFEHTAFFHVSSLAPDVRRMLMKEFAEEDLPFNTYYGDGSPIEDSVLEGIRAAYRQSACRFSWQQRDLLLVDNMLVSHGREPFTGPRNILVAMAELADGGNT
ncbi:MAG TPA: TauD/TfdA family dioxygenase [Pyrinomonadaceae bacterium]|nr:TauD/TfdA family dioxygenase [Pyrinomonadaceae bacterium]